MRHIWIPNRTFSKFYNPNVATDELTVLFKGTIILWQYIPNKHKGCGIKIYKLCDSTGYIWHEGFLAEGQTVHSTTLYSTQCHSDRTDTETRRTRSQSVHGQFLFLSWLVWWHNKEKKYNCCRTVRSNRKGHATWPTAQENENRTGRH